MGLVRRTLCLRRPRASKEDMQRLLYGKRRNAVHSTSTGRPSASLLLMKGTDTELASTTKRAVAMQELSREDLLSVFKSNRVLRRWDRTMAIVSALEEAKYPLTAYHYSLLMAHANDQRETAKALAFWEKAVQDGKVNAKLHGALLATYRNLGRWKEAVQHCHSMWEDKLVLDPHALHTVLNACRRSGPWQAGLEVFSRAVGAGTRPNNVVYLELLRVLEHARGMPSRWKYALAILDALHGKVDVTAGHYNAVLATLGGPHLWMKGVALFEAMKERSVQPSRDTLNQLLLLNPSNVAHCVTCVAEAHALGMPVTDAMYRAVLSNLFRLGLDHEASQFAEREYRRDTEDPGRPSTSTLSLSLAMVDSLLAHPRPQDALRFYESFEPKLGYAVGPATRALGSLGQASQRWLVQGRVAVADHNILLSTRMESLLHHYDSVFLPFSSVRLLVRRARQLGNTTTQGRFTRFTFQRLRRLLQEEPWSRAARVLPFAHQLQAHQYLVEGPANQEALRLLRSEAVGADGGGPTLTQRLLGSVTSGVAQGSSGPPLSGEGPAEEPLIIRSSGSAAGGSVGYSPATTRRRAPATRAEARTAAHTPTGEPYKLREPSRVSSAERVLAVAVMLKSLNSNADVHVLSTNVTQLQVVAEWNARSPNAPLTAVRYPEELFAKAPPAEEAAADRQRPQKTARTAHHDGPQSSHHSSFLTPS